MTQLKRRNGTVICEAEGTLRDVVLEAYKKGLDLRGADLRGADLGGVKLNWSSHDILAHILVSSAGNDLQRRMLAGLVLVSRDWCWEQFAALDLPETLVRWAVEVLAPWAEFSAPPELFVELAQRLAIALPTSEVTTDGRNEDRVV